MDGWMDGRTACIDRYMSLCGIKWILNVRMEDGLVSTQLYR